ncbi:MAG: phosphatase PAP2 family protein [Oligoflexia bacterium]|nr:phosphatase PAP2 family protein [Oligoflexia bacterium]
MLKHLLVISILFTTVTTTAISSVDTSVSSPVGSPVDAVKVKDDTKKDDTKKDDIKKDEAKKDIEKYYSTNHHISICRGILSNLLVPFCTDARYIMFYGSLLTSGVYFSRTNTSNRVRVEALKSQPLNPSVSQIGNYIGLGFLNGSYFLQQFFWGDKKNAELMAEASLYTALVTLVLKTTVSEARPGNPNDTNSFPSGHTSMAFAFASVVGIKHQWYWGLLAYATAAFISYSRIQSDYHYLHDVIFGATLGLTYGFGINHNHQIYGKPYWVDLLPTKDSLGGKLTFNLGF